MAIMAEKKKTTRKRKKKHTKAGPKKSLRTELTKIFTGLAVLVLLVVLTAVFVDRTVVRKPAPTPAGQKAVSTPAPAPVKRVRVKKSPAVETAVVQPPQYEVFPEKEIPPQRPVITPPAEKARLPRVAIIIDDLGYDNAIAKKFAALDAPLTFSILPISPQNRKIAREAEARGLEVMLHIPMEPMEYPRIDPGPGALLTTMTPDELIRAIEASLATIPHAKGVNNHMGSRLTTDSDRMNQIFTLLKRRNLFFIDSRTTAESVSSQSARLFQVPYGQRDVFLDHDQDPRQIRKQLKRLVRYAQNHGQAIGIGHPHTVTYEVLKEMIPQLKQQVTLVPASQVVHPAG